MADAAQSSSSSSAPSQGASPGATLGATLGLLALFCLPLLSGGYSGAGYQVGLVLLPVAAAIAWASSSSRPAPAGWTVTALLLLRLTLGMNWPFEGKLLWAYSLCIPAAWLCVTTLLRDVPQRRTWLWPAILGSAALSALYGLYEMFFVYTDEPHLLGTFGLHNAYAGFLLIVWPLALLAAQESPAAKQRGIWLACGLLLGAALLLTQSRAAWMIFGLQLLFLLLSALQRMLRSRSKNTERQLLAALGGLIAVLLALLALPAVRSTLAGLLDFGGYSMQGRLRFWSAALEIFRDHPLGIGLGAFGQYYPEYQRDYVYFSSDPHSWPLQLLAELGLPGLLILLLLVYAALRWSAAVWRRLPGAESALLLAAFWGSLLHAAVDFDYTFPATTALLGALLAYGSWRADSMTAGQSAAQRQAPRYSVVLLCTLLAVAAIAGEFQTLERYMLDELRRAPQTAVAARQSLLERAITFNPQNYRSRYQLASLLAQPGRSESERERALEELERSLQENPRYSVALALRGLLARPQSAGDKDLELALKLDPYNYPEHYFYYATLAQDDETKRERLLLGVERIPAEHPIKPDHVRAPNWYELNPMWAQWWYELAKLTEDEEEAALYRRRGANFQTYWESVLEERGLRGQPQEEQPAVKVQTPGRSGTSD